MSDEIPVVIPEIHTEGSEIPVITPEIQVVGTAVRIDPNEEITLEKKIILLTQWKEKVDGEIAECTAEKDKIMTAYRAQKEKFDKLLAVKLRRVKKIDAVLSNRKKVLMEIVKEIDIATKPPTE
jgi:hypothetical protein